MKNEKIRNALLKRGMKQWELAKLLGIGEATFCRWMREEMPPEKQNKIITIIEESNLND